MDIFWNNTLHYYLSAYTTQLGVDHQMVCAIQCRKEKHLSYQQSVFLLDLNRTQTLIPLYQQRLCHYQTNGSYGDDNLTETWLG